MSNSEVIDRFLASLLLHAQLTGRRSDLSLDELNELIEAINGEHDSGMSPDQQIS